jgi:hypothetical protein
LPPRLISQPPPPNADHWPQSFCIHTGSRYEAWCSPTFAAPLGRNTRGKTATNSTEFRPGRGLAARLGPTDWSHPTTRARQRRPKKEAPATLEGAHGAAMGGVRPHLDYAQPTEPSKRGEHSAGPAPLIDAIYTPVTFDGMTAFPPPTAARIGLPSIGCI